MDTPPVGHRRALAVGVLSMAVTVALTALLAGCSTPPVASNAAAVAAPAAPSAPVPQPRALPPWDWSDAVMYFAIVDRFADGDPGNNARVDRAAKGTFHGGDLRGLTAHIDEIASLGVNALWITPVVKQIDGFVTGAGFPDWGYHGYWADDFTRLDPRFGTEDDLKRLVDACHERGIRVLLDVVYNHAGYGSRYTTDGRTRSWLRLEERGECKADGPDLTQCVAGLPDFKTELPEVADYLMDAHIALAERTGLDGFRLDTLKHVDHPFWQEHRKRTRARLGQHFFLIGELWGGQADSLNAYFEPDEIDAGFDFSFQGSALGWLQGRGRTVAFDRYLMSRENVRQGHFLAPFLSSHDVDGALHLLDGDKRLFQLAALIKFTIRGIPVIYYGEEVARAGGTWPHNRSDMPWGARQILPGAGAPRDEALREAYRRLVSIRAAHPALRRGDHKALSTEGDLYVFVRRDASANDAVVVAVNRGQAPVKATVPAPAEWSGAPARDEWNGEEVAVTDGKVTIEVAPRGARILVRRSAK